MNKKVLILNDGSDYQNWGIKACIDGLKIILQRIPGIETTTLPHAFMIQKYAFEPKILGRKIFLENNRLAKRILRDFHVLPRVADEFEQVAELWLKGRGGPGAKIFMEKAKDIDAVIFNAEGSTYRNNIGAVKGLFMLWFAKTKLDKKSMFLNGSVTLTKVDAILPAMVNKVFSEIDLVGVREPDSHANIVQYYPSLKDKIKVFPDSVFSLDTPKQSALKNLDFLDKEFFVFSLSMLPMDYKISREKSSIIKIVRQLKKVVHNVVLIAKDVEDQVLKEIADLTDSSFIGPQFNYQEIMQILSRAKFLFSGRYHHLIFATKVGCPVIPMASSSQKIHGLSSLFSGLMPSPIDPTNLNAEEEYIIQNAMQIVEGGTNLRDRYIERSNELKAEALNQAGLISKILLEKA